MISFYEVKANIHPDLTILASTRTASDQSAHCSHCDQKQSEGGQVKVLQGSVLSLSWSHGRPPHSPCLATARAALLTPPPQVTSQPDQTQLDHSQSWGQQPPPHYGG